MQIIFHVFFFFLVHFSLVTSQWIFFQADHKCFKAQDEHDQNCIRISQPTNRKWCFRNLNKNVSNDMIDICAGLYIRKIQAIAWVCELSTMCGIEHPCACTYVWQRYVCRFAERPSDANATHSYRSLVRYTIAICCMYTLHMYNCIWLPVICVDLFVCAFETTHDRAWRKGGIGNFILTTVACCCRHWICASTRLFTQNVV